MKFKINKEKKYEGKTRIVHKFLFLPKVINGECRWLEFAKFEQKLVLGYYGDCDWEDIEWKN